MVRRVAFAWLAAAIAVTGCLCGICVSAVPLSAGDSDTSSKADKENALSLEARKACASSGYDTAECVRMLVGTGGHAFGYGSDDMCAQVPFGAMRIGPDTKGMITLPFQHFSGFYSADRHIRAFSHTRLVGAGVGDYGNFGIMPVAKVDGSVIQLGKASQKFKEEDQVAKPGVYTVKLQETGVAVRLVATGSHAGIHEYVWPQGAQQPASLIMNACHGAESPTKKAGGTFCYDGALEFALGSDNILRVNSSILFKGSLSGRIGGDGLPLFFAADLHVPSGATVSAGTWSNGALDSAASSGSQTESGGSLGLWTTVKGCSDGCRLVLRVAVSWISTEQARQNLQQQVPESIDVQTVDTAASSAFSLWKDSLYRVRVRDHVLSDRGQVQTATAAYHTLVAPSIQEEANGVYMGMDGNPHSLVQGSNWSYSSDMSLWDTHRSQFPWLDLYSPRAARNTALSLIQMAKDGGDLPRWPLANIYTGCMEGSHAFLVLLDALKKGTVSEMEVSPVLQDMIAEASGTSAKMGFKDADLYNKLGYLPVDSDKKGVSLTLEYSYDDWALAQGLRNTDIEKAKFYFKRSRNYRHMFDDRKLFMCSKDSNGTFHCPLDPAAPVLADQHYTEGNAWQWTFYAPHDPVGLVELFGTQKTYCSRLNEFYERSKLHPSNALPDPYYWAGNEPDILSPWISVFGNCPELSQSFVRWLVKHKYSDAPDGIPGNDDYGTLSAWLLWATMGIYPITGSTLYVMASPSAANTSILMENGHSLTVLARNENNHSPSESDVFVSSITFNNEITLPAPVIPHDMLTSQGLSNETCQYLQLDDNLCKTVSDHIQEWGSTIQFNLSSEPQEFGRNIDWKQTLSNWLEFNEDLWL